MSRRERWNERYAGKELVWSAGPNKLLATELQSSKPGTALDVACGEGRNALWLAEQGWEVTAVDFSEVGIDKGRQIARHRGVEIDWRIADLAVDPWPASTYDLVCVMYLHTDPLERSQWLPRAIEAVAPGGTFFYVGHDPNNIEQGVGGPQNRELLPGVAELTALLEGFDIVRAEIVERQVEADPGHGGGREGTALDTFVRAVRQRLSRP